MGIEVEILEFEDGVETVEKAARLSGEEPRSIIKTILLGVGDDYAVAMVRGDRRINLEALSRILGRNARLARAKEVREVLGVDVGSVSPLNPRVRSLKVFMDPAILELENVLCGGGSPRRLIRVRVRDLVDLLNPLIIEAFE